nr:MAG TPA: hypothetical protein [Caudoviricetes sp.]DAY01659.1 MAG TPA: hypothetical protein [Caudoviricetes sp.]
MYTIRTYFFFILFNYFICIHNCSPYTIECIVL